MSHVSAEQKSSPFFTSSGCWAATHFPAVIAQLVFSVVLLFDRSSAELKRREDLLLAVRFKVRELSALLAPAQQQAAGR